MIKIDLTGQRFGRLVVIERAGVDRRSSTWRCRCDCGGIAVVAVKMLRPGYTKSCGCLRRESAVANGKASAPKVSAARRRQVAAARVDHTACDLERLWW